jgi:4-alpha-glucanotransferase
MSDSTLIERLARLRGIGDAYHDYRGELRYFSRETKTEILRAMGAPVDDPAALAAELRRLEIERWRTLLPAVAAANGERIGVDLNISARDFGATLVWTVDLESGVQHAGTQSSGDCPEIWRGEVEGSWITRRRLELPLALPPGRHELEVRIGSTASRCILLLSPAKCYEPRALASGARLWGLAVQLYAVRSKNNWGIGDFGDLKTLIRWLASRGAGFVGLNPLHALAPADPERASPYSASSRHFLNVLYISVFEVPEFQECARARERVAGPDFTRRLEALRAAPLVDYRGVAAVKLEVLEILFQDFRDRQLAHGTERASAYRGFLAEGGRALQMHARFDALDAHFRTTLGTASGWQCWPAEFRDPDGGAARQFAAEHPERVDFYAYLQWLAHEQLASAQSLARDLGMPVGLYGDYAVGTHPSGSETWVDQNGFRLGAEIGAPPDPLALKGQGWGLPPPDPVLLESRHFESFAKLIRNNMRCYGALRLDHVMSLFRLWWVPGARSPVEGAYVHYPLHQLLTVLALESARNACLVVGEDLGVVPDEMRRAMPEFGLYHYKVLLFESEHGRFRRPNEYLRCSLATVTTHDLPTLRSFWENLDIELRSALRLYPSEELERDVREARSRDRDALLAALKDESLLPQAYSGHAFTFELAHALHCYLARSSSALVTIQIEDLLGMTEPVNVPGTHQEYPNWQRKLSEGLEAIEARADLDRCFEEINRERGSA